MGLSAMPPRLFKNVPFFLTENAPGNPGAFYNINLKDHF